MLAQLEVAFREFGCFPLQATSPTYPDLSLYSDQTKETLTEAVAAFKSAIFNVAVTTAYEALIEQIRAGIRHRTSQYSLRELQRRNDEGVLDIAVRLNIVDKTEKKGILSLKTRRELSTHRKSSHRFSSAEAAAIICETARYIEAVSFF